MTNTSCCWVFWGTGWCWPYSFFRAKRRWKSGYWIYLFTLLTVPFPCMASYLSRTVDPLWRGFSICFSSFGSTRQSTLRKLFMAGWNHEKKQRRSKSRKSFSSKALLPSTQGNLRNFWPNTHSSPKSDESESAVHVNFPTSRTVGPGPCWVAELHRTPPKAGNFNAVLHAVGVSA